MKSSVKTFQEALQKASDYEDLAEQLGRLDTQITLSADQTVLWQYSTAGAESVSLDAPQSVWAEALSQYPRPGFQSIGAMYRLCSEFQIQGETRAFMQALPILELLVEYARKTLHPDVNEAIDDDLGQISGRYVRTAHGWVFVEEAGNPDGPVICFLHTAGADARQWHGLMTMPQMQDWRLIAFDMPNHGRSPVLDDATQWQWRLNESTYVDIVHQVLKAVTDKPVVLMGCSMGAAVGLPLLASHPAQCRAAILLETPFHSPGRRTPFLDHPQVHGSRLAATWVASLLSPRSPKQRRNLARWIYSQSAPGVYDGDLRFYSDEFRAAVHAGKINTARTPLWLLTGDYDYSASPSETRKVAQAIEGSVFIEMAGFGHFPMTEDPHRLYECYLADILSALRQSS